MAQIRQLDSAGRVKLASSWVLNSPAAFPKGQIMSWLFPRDKVAVTLLVLCSWLHLWLRLQCGQAAGTYAPASAVPWLERSCKIGIPQIESTRAALGSGKEVRQIFRWGFFCHCFSKSIIDWRQLCYSEPILLSINVWDYSLKYWKNT